MVQTCYAHLIKTINKALMMMILNDNKDVDDDDDDDDDKLIYKFKCISGIYSVYGSPSSGIRRPLFASVSPH